MRLNQLQTMQQKETKISKRVVARKEEQGVKTTKKVLSSRSRRRLIGPH